MSKHHSVCLRTGLLAKGLSTLLICSLVQFIVITSQATLSNAQGFSNQKLELFPRMPPRMSLNGTNPILKFNSQATIGYDLLQETRKTMEAYLRRQSFYSMASENAEIEIDCTVIDLQAYQNSVKMWRSEYQRTGSHSETDSMGMSRTVDDYGYANVQQDGIGVDARIGLKYEMKDSTTGIVLDAETINTGFYQEYETASVPDINSVHRELLNKVATELGDRFASQTYKIDVILPKGKLKQASDLLAKRQWTEARKSLESIPKFSQSRDEAFRLYALGIANEAFAYDATDLATAREHLIQASKLYNQARVIKPDQLEFWWSEGRSSDLAWRYGKADEKARAFGEARKQVIEGSLAAEDASERIYLAGENADAPLSVGPGFDGVSNRDVIEWAKAGVPEPVIKSTVKRVGQLGRYDLSHAGLSDLSKAGVSKSTIKEMRETQQPEGPSKSWIVMTVVMTALPYVPLLLRSRSPTGRVGRGCD